MEHAQERRHHRRLPIPVPAVVEAPYLSETPLVPKDVSQGGFRVEVRRKPALHARDTCGIGVREEAFEDCDGTVVWIKDNETDPPTWDIGLTFSMGDVSAQRLAEVLEELAGETGDSPLPGFA